MLNGRFQKVRKRLGGAWRRHNIYHAGELRGKAVLQHAGEGHVSAAGNNDDFCVVHKHLHELGANRGEDPQEQKGASRDLEMGKENRNRMNVRANQNVQARYLVQALRMPRLFTSKVAEARDATGKP
jgi:hypothetical protein